MLVLLDMSKDVIYVPLPWCVEFGLSVRRGAPDVYVGEFVQGSQVETNRSRDFHVNSRSRLVYIKFGIS